MHTYESDWGSLPPAFIANPEGKPIHSWRVLLLPYLDEDGLYGKYDFTSPWDSPENQKLVTQVPGVFQCPGDLPIGNGDTSYVVITGRSTAFPCSEGRPFAQFSDGLSQTILVAEMAESSIPWTAPYDLSFAAMSDNSNDGKDCRIRALSDAHANCAAVALADASIHWVPNDYRAEKLKGFATVNGNEVLPKFYDAFR